MKSDLCRNLQTQLEAQKRRLQTDGKKQIESLEAKVDALQYKLDERHQDVEQKNFMIDELKK